MSPSIADLVRLDSVCDAFEESWKAGSRPRLEEYLESTNLPSATLFVELVQIDIDYRRRHGESPSVGEYAAKFPQFEEALSEIASLLGTTDATVSVPAKPLPMLGRFELAAELGRGSFGVVWKAWDTKMRRWVALKQFHEGIARGNRKLYEREARSVAQLDHPNVVRVLELSEGTASDYIVFELIEGESLKSWLTAREGKPVDPRLAAEIVLQIAQGLQHVHERDIVHRDLKPGNILITKEGVPKLVDFGLARHLDSLSTIAHDKTLLGTIPYMSPEQCRSEKVTASTDIYSLGVVLYELLAGRRPFAGVQSELLAQIQYRDAPSLRGKGIPVDMERICRRAMEKEPVDRYPTVAAMASDLTRFLRGESLKPNGFRFRKIARAILNRRSMLVTAIGGAAAISTYAAVTLQTEVDDGLMRVRMTTEPVGAKVAFIPLDDTNSRPRIDQKTEAPTTSPVDLQLNPGDYLVIAYLDDGRFHEVYRHVPKDPSVTRGPHRHSRWVRESGGGVSLLPIDIPELKVSESMVLVDGTERHSLSGQGPSERRGIACRVPSFLVDATEYRVREFKERKLAMGADIRSLKSNLSVKLGLPDDHAVSVDFDEAIALAEGAGKRLLHEWEYDFLATARGDSRYPWGNDLPVEQELRVSLGPVGTPTYDQFVSHGRPIFGLCSNLAEWVDSYAPTGARLWSLSGIPQLDASGLRAVRGGNPDAIEYSSDAEFNPTKRGLISKYTNKLGIGFRCARSIRPRLAESDFVRLLAPPG